MKEHEKTSLMRQEPHAVFFRQRQRAAYTAPLPSRSKRRLRFL